jgi:signal transduction histidine kinase
LLVVAPVAFIFVVGAGALAFGAKGSDVPWAVLLAGLVVSTIALLLRHRAPAIVLAVVLIVSLTTGWGPVVVLPVLLAIFTVAEYDVRRTLIATAILAAVGLVATGPIHHQHLTFTGVLSRLAPIGLAVALGLYLRARADYITGLRDRAARLEREQALLAQQAVGEERVRIARELHDVVAHNVSLMVVQAQALAATGGDSEQRQALGRVADLGRDALSEMHRMLGVLRLQNGGAAERQPQPGVADLGTLIARTREAGLQTSLTVEGEPRDLPTAVDLSVYRIVQEALTNVVRHARADHATVTLAYSTGSVEITVLDDGAGETPPAGGGGPNGHGLVGMRERVALFGGELEAGRRRYGEGYRVHARLPIA